VCFFALKEICFSEFGGPLIFIGAVLVVVNVHEMTQKITGNAIEMTNNSSAKWNFEACHLIYEGRFIATVCAFAIYVHFYRLRRLAKNISAIVIIKCCIFPLG
jgi:hypothetical protein